MIAVHLCATERDELAQVAEASAAAVLCPRSNLFIELKLPPLYDILAAGLEAGSRHRLAGLQHHARCAGRGLLP